jgi:hypothetical protein
MMYFDPGATIHLGNASMGIERSKIEEYRANAARCEWNAKKTRNQEDREWQSCLARAYRMLAEAEAERGVLHGKLTTGRTV